MSYLRDTFAAVADVSGHINKEQLRDALQRAGLNPTIAQVEKLWAVMDRDRCGKVQLRELGDMGAGGRKRRESPERYLSHCMCCPSLGVRYELGVNVLAQ